MKTARQLLVFALVTPFFLSWGCGGNKNPHSAAPSNLIEQLIKAERRAKTVEAVDELDRIYEGAVMYFEDTAASDGQRLPLDCPFPTPGMPAAGTPECPSDSTVDGVDPTWSALSSK